MARKKVLFVLVLAAFVAGGVFAQEAQAEVQKSANVKKLWVSGEVSLLGAGARLEFMLTPKLSVGLDAYWTSLFFIFNDIGVNAVARFYPWGKTFYGGLGLGLGIHSGIEDFVKDGETYENTLNIVTRTGFDIVPELGWKIDVGKPGGFFLNPVLQLPLTLGKSKLLVGNNTEGDFGMSVGFRVAFGLGGAFL
jgi:hypothetical protein